MAKGSHPKHPPCPGCGRALYKSGIVGKQVKKDDPWAWCRNKSCERHGKDQTKFTTGVPELDAGLAGGIPHGRLTEVSARAPNVPAVGPSRPPPEAVVTLPKEAATAEHPSITHARDRIRNLIGKALADNETAPHVIGLTLALVSQETGNHAAANALIEQYGFESLGITMVVDAKKP